MPHSLVSISYKPSLNVLTSSSSTSRLNWKKPRVRSSSTPFSDNGAAMASTLKKERRSVDIGDRFLLGYFFPAQMSTNQWTWPHHCIVTSSERNVRDEIARRLFRIVAEKNSHKPFLHDNASFFHSIWIKVTSINQVLSLTVQFLHTCPSCHDLFFHHLKLYNNYKFNQRCI